MITPNKQGKRIQISTMRAIFSHFQLYFPESLQRFLEVVLLPHHRIVLQIQDAQRLLHATLLEEGPARSQGVVPDLELHHLYVLDLRLEVALPRSQLTRRGVPALEFTPDGGEIGCLAVYLPLLDGQFHLHDALVDCGEVVDCQAVFHHQQADDEVVPSVVLLVVLFDQGPQAPLDQEVLEQLVVRLAVVLVTDSLIHSRFIRILIFL